MVFYLNFMQQKAYLISFIINRKNPMRVFLICFFLFGFSGVLMASTDSTTTIRLAEEATAYIQENGREKGLQVINDSTGPFVQGEFYVFVYDMTGVVLANALRPDLVGVNVLRYPDTEGNLYRKKIIDRAQTEGSGWIEYETRHPVTRTVELKRVYFRKSGDLVICCGYYPNKPATGQGFSDAVTALANMFLTLLNNMAVLILTAYIFSRTRIYEELMAGKRGFKNMACLVFITGLLSIYGTVSGVDIMGNIANVRDLGPMIAGFVAGPLAGVLTGLIGGTHRYLSGGESRLPCALATVLAGLLAGLFYRFNNRKFVGVKTAAIFAGAFEVLHSTLVLFLYGVHEPVWFGDFMKEFDKVLGIEKATTLPRVVVVALGVGAFAYIIDNLVRERKEQEETKRIEHELKGAREIQMNIVPKIFPPFPHNPNVELFAYIEPARNVGGDLYDFFFLGKNRFCFLVGDVSDKGIPASLFMAVTITLLRAKATPDIAPDQLLSEVNNALCQKNESLMFVTLFCGIMDLDTGEVTYANAGHNPPYQICVEDKFVQLPVGKGMALGVMENTGFENRSLKLKPGQGLFIYTDGVNEAENSQGQGFGYPRFETLLNTGCHRSCEDLVMAVIREINQFQEGVPPHDDITALAVKYIKKA